MYEGADFAERDLPLEQLVSAAEVVVVGEFGSVIGPREVAEDFELVQLELVVNEVISGDVAQGDVLVFEGWGDEVGKPSGEALYFLVEKVSDVDPPGIYTWHTSRGIWADTQRADVDTPIAEDPPSNSDLYSDEIDDAGTLADVIDLVRDFAAGG